MHISLYLYLYIYIYVYIHIYSVNRTWCMYVCAPFQSVWRGAERGHRVNPNPLTRYRDVCMYAPCLVVEVIGQFYFGGRRSSAAVVPVGGPRSTRNTTRNTTELL